MTAWILVPVRSVADGKRRLAGALDEADRIRLNTFLLARAIATAKRAAGADRTAVVTSAPDVIAQARAAGIRVVDHPRALDLNAALNEALRRVHASGAIDVLVWPCDEPLVKPSDLATMLRAKEALIAPDRHETGTNALFLPHRLVIPFQFGVDSFRNHRAAFARRRLALRVHRNPRLAFDLDRPADLARWLAGADLAARIASTDRLE